MANRDIPPKGLDPAHLPTFLLLIGYPIYWLELYLFKSKNGITTPLAAIIFIVFAIIILYRERSAIKSLKEELVRDFKEAKGIDKIFRLMGGGFVALIFICTLYASLLPPHLLQEFDALNYHITLPRQHLIWGTFKHIPWSSGDLFPLPVDFALSPYWFATPLPNKFPQFIFFIGLVLVALNLLRRLEGGKDWAAVWCLVFAIFGSHAIGIQMGLAMLDMVICYLFLAALDSFLKGPVYLAAIELTFFFWAKSFLPIQSLVILILIGSIWIVFKKMGWKIIPWGLSGPQVFSGVEMGERIKKMFLAFLILSIFIGGPFVARSLYYSGTPLYPFTPGLFQLSNRVNSETPAWQGIVKASAAHLNSRDDYGSGRDGLAFVKHIWLLAVPEKDVNNKFDYPMGLPYLLFLGAFLFLFTRQLRRKEISIGGLFIIIYWFLWWEGSQQTRFLYIPLLVMFIFVAPLLRTPSKILMGALIIALMFNALSIVRAHKRDFFRSFKGPVLRDKDQELIAMNQKYLSEGRTDFVYLDYHDVAFAQFPVIVTKEKLPFVMKLSE